MPRHVLVYPHQLFAEHPAITPQAQVYLVEDPLFFRHYAFHKQKLLFHRASMQAYADHCHTVTYIAADQLTHTKDIFQYLPDGADVHVAHLADDWLQQAVQRGAEENGGSVTEHPSPGFLDCEKAWFAGKQKLYMASYYKRMRKYYDVLMDGDSPTGGRWSFDTDNRQPMHSELTPPSYSDNTSSYVANARKYVESQFPDNPGNTATFIYPIDYESARAWLRQFLNERFAQFGPYQDALSKDHAFLYHSLLSPLINAGLLTPQEVLDHALAYEKQVPMQSLEGLVRQILGWREFMHGAYLHHGRVMRTRNYFGHTNSMPNAFYTGTTGIPPIDTTITRVLRHGYAHHIERLMVLGNFMLLCEIDPDAIYQWFMELFVDAYDWVMVPNVYAMSQFADGRLLTTKPYISSSNYIRKMSDYPKGEWCTIWDQLFWRFVNKHKSLFEKNPRTRMLAAQADKHTDYAAAEAFLAGLWQ